MLAYLRPPATGHRRGRARDVVTGLALVAAFGLTGMLLDDRVPPLDRWILAHLYAGPGSLPEAASGVASLAALATLVVTLVAAARRAGRRAPGILARHLLLLAACLTPLPLQAVFQRPGPGVTAADWTFPSGHGVAVTAAGLTAVVLSRGLPGPWRAPVLATAVGSVLLVSVSRVLLGEHYQVDMAAAVLVTVGVGLAAAAALRLPPRDR